MGLENVPRCRHVKANGTQCGSPALRRRRVCYFHQRVQDMKVRVLTDESTQGRFCMPVLEDAHGVQMALMQVLEQLAWGRMDHKTAGLMLYGLQTASVNLRNMQQDRVDPTDVVIDRDTVRWTRMDGPQWVEEDFDEEEEDEEPEEKDAETEPAVLVIGQAVSQEAVNAVKNGPPAPESVKDSADVTKPRPPAAERVNMNEVRENVKGLIRNWIMETVEGKAREDSGG